jgi:hypothetical protein
VGTSAGFRPHALLADYEAGKVAGPCSTTTKRPWEHGVRAIPTVILTGRRLSGCPLRQYRRRIGRPVPVAGAPADPDHVDTEDLARLQIMDELLAGFDAWARSCRPSALPRDPDDPAYTLAEDARLPPRAATRS